MSLHCARSVGSYFDAVYMVMGVKTDAISAKMDRLEPPWPPIKTEGCKLPMT